MKEGLRKILMAIEKERKIGFSKLVLATELSKPVLADYLNQLVKKGYLKVEINSKDKRKKYYQLTEKGRGFLDALNSIKNVELERELFSLLVSGKGEEIYRRAVFRTTLFLLGEICIHCMTTMLRGPDFTTRAEYNYRMLINILKEYGYMSEVRELEKILYENRMDLPFRLEEDSFVSRFYKDSILDKTLKKIEKDSNLARAESKTMRLKTLLRLIDIRNVEVNSSLAKLAKEIYDMGKELLELREKTVKNKQPFW